MRLFLRFRLICYSLLTCCLFSACQSIFDVHPYDMNLHGEHDINAAQIGRIRQLYNTRDTLRIAFISDTHQWYTQTKAEIADINSRSNIDFVVHCGDMTDTGTTNEFRMFRNILRELKVPYVVVLGNHDFLGTGDQTYEWMFGPRNFSFIVSRIC